MRKQIFLCKKSFTLAETMLVVVILGIIAILVVPQLIRRQVEISNRTKLKKAMAAYDYLMNRMILENDLHSNTALKTWGATCSNSANYFKISQETSDPCVFKTTDGVWWNIENIQQPMVAFKQDDLDDELAKKTDNNKAFYFVAHYDDQGIIRISDNAYEVQRLSNLPDDEVTDGDKAMAKLFGFVKNKKVEEPETEVSCSTIDCEVNKYKNSPCENPNAYSSGGCSNCNGCYTYDGHVAEFYDEDGHFLYTIHTDMASNGLFIQTFLGERDFSLDNCESKGKNCTDCYDGSRDVCNSFLDSETGTYSFNFDFDNLQKN